jgi:hypothetical protein
VNKKKSRLKLSNEIKELCGTLGGLTSLVET